MSGSPYAGQTHIINDGAVIEAEEFDLGGQGVAYNDANTANNGGAFRPTEAVDIQTTTDVGGGFNVGWTANGEWLEYTFETTGGVYDITARVASNSGNVGDLQLQVGDGVTFTNLGTITVNNTGGWQAWADSTLAGVRLDAGTQVLRVNMQGGNININRFTFDASITPAPTTGTAAVTGSHAVGQTLTASQGTLFDDNGIQTIAYLWQRQANGAITSINTGYSPDNADYTLTAADGGNEVRVVARVTDQLGNNTWLASPFTAVTASNPQSPTTGLPAVTGTSTVGQTLTATTGTLADPNGIQEVAYLWQRLVNGAFTDLNAGYSVNNSTYALVAADAGTEVRVVARITDGLGTIEYKASASTAVQQATTTTPSPTTGAAEVTGTHTVGQTLTVGQGTLADPNGIQTIAYQWQRLNAGGGIDNLTNYSATNTSYTLVAADSGDQIRVVARVTDNLNTNVWLPTAFVTVAAAANTTPAPTTGLPGVTGTGTVGQTLTATTGTLADPNGIQEVAYLWQRLVNGVYVNINGGYSVNNGTYTLVAADAGTDVRVVARVTDDLGTIDYKASAATAVQQATTTTPSPTTGAPAVTGTHNVGQTLTAGQGTLADPNGIQEIAYLWQRSVNGTFTNINAGYSVNNATYTLTAADAGGQVRVAARITDNLGTIEYKASPLVAVTNNSQQTGTTTAVASGNWTNAATWSNGVPTSSTQVIIPQNRVVTLNTVNAQAQTVVVHGTLTVNETAGQNRGLTTRWMHVNSGGLFQVGTAANRFDTANFTLTLTGRDRNADWTIPTATGSINITNNDGFLMPAGGGRLQLFGDDKISFTRLSATAVAGTSTIFVANVIERNYDGTTSAASDGRLNWQVGDQIVIASSGQDYSDEEVRTITGVTDLGNGNTRLSLNAALSNRHYGEIERYDNNSRAIDLRAEVALLSRNVKIQGVAAADTDNAFGDRARFQAFNANNPNATGNGVSGHIMIMPTAGRVNFDGVQFDRLGQTATRGRYPIHWHLGGDRTGDSLVRASVTNSNNRGVTVHGTNNLLIQDVVLHDIHGHGFFLEDAVERGNTFLSNITFGIHQIGVKVNPNRGGTGYNQFLETDRNDPFIVDTHDVVQQNETRFVSAAGYWVTNPDNDFIGNISAGAFGTGFWFLFPDSAIGAYANDPNFNGFRPDKLNLGEFRNNSSHSSIIGLNFDRGSDIEGDINATLQPRSFGDEYNPPVEPLIDGFTAYKHNVGIYHRGRTAHFRNTALADNFNGTFITFTQRLTNTLYVGHSRGNADTSEIVTGHTFYDGPNTLTGTHFAGFQRDNAHTYRSAFIAVRNTHFVMSDTSFENDGSGGNVSTTVNTGGTTNIQPFGKGQPSVIYDADGSFTGSRGGGAGYTVIPDHPFYYDANDIKPQGWKARISDDPYGTFRISGANNPMTEIVAPDGGPGERARTGSSGGFGINAVFKMNPLNTNQTDAGTYRISFPFGYTGNFNVNYTAVAGPLGWTMMEFTNQSTNQVANRPQVGSLGALNNATQTSWARSGSSIFVKFFATRGNNSQIQFRPNALQAAEAAGDSGETPVTLTRAELDSLVDDAKAYWIDLGADAALLEEVEFVVGDLGSNLLGLQGGNTVYIDDDAAGHGWYVDLDPTTDEWFDGMDLFTTVTHEIGHVLGFEDLYSVDDQEELMYGYLSEGERRASLN
ncbi:MAG: carbohydrate-binding protein [Planctomycetota bacterium]